MKATITLTEPTTCQNVFTGEIHSHVSTLCMDMEEGSCVFLTYIQT
ncbi:MAG: hypothetical protein IJY42_00745 [Clostridia bacterium]|nr:hypothetical protein [Clostridia bacterium]